MHKWGKVLMGLETQGAECEKQHEGLIVNRINKCEIALADESEELNFSSDLPPTLTLPPSLPLRGSDVSLVNEKAIEYDLSNLVCLASVVILLEIRNHRRLLTIPVVQDESERCMCHLEGFCINLETFSYSLQYHYLKGLLGTQIDHLYFHFFH